MKMYRFKNAEKEVNVISESESSGRIRAKLSVDYVLHQTFCLNKLWK